MVTIIVNIFSKASWDIQKSKLEATLFRTNAVCCKKVPYSSFLSWQADFRSHLDFHAVQFHLCLQSDPPPI